ncbi:MAG: hypothetical protein M3Z92_12490, partial [Bacteroidota bacterium]|nr:hypothetical protein [Bacteroidota bacterium]
MKNKNVFFKKVVKSFSRDTSEVQAINAVKRNDLPFLQYRGYVIRNIVVSELPFGIPIADTAKRIVTSITRLANHMHRRTRSGVIRNNLFFNKNDTVKPYLLADNITFLRQLPYILDASIKVVPIPGSLDSVDIMVVTKDVFSIGGSLGSLGLKKSDIEIREDNFEGTGNALVFQSLFDNHRYKNFGFGTGYIQRNIGGSFINGALGYQSFYTAIDGPKEENLYYFDLLKPLVNRYMRWTYELNTSYHSTRNMYSSDSVYFNNNRYRYFNLEAWAGYNINSKGYTIQKEDSVLRKLAGLRIIDRKFQDIPLKYSSLYYWKYANLEGVLGSLTFYRQNFYKTQYIYGFGRNEDIPEGLNLTLTAGLTKKQNVLRSFIGFNYDRSFFNKKNNYISYTIRAEGNLRGTSLEDITFLSGIAYVEHLNSLGPSWKQRFFLNLDVAQQVNTVFNEPLLLQSSFGLPEFGNSQVGGTLRATIKAESVFFSPWSLAAFRFAPFVFVNTSVFSPYLSDANIYSSVGGGIRTRNESLIFGTLELKAFYFPGKNYYNESFRFDISTNVRFKYNPQLIRKPDFIQ